MFCDGVGLGVVMLIGDAAGVISVGVDGSLVFNTRVEEVQLHRDLTGVLVGDAAHIPHVMWLGVLKVFSGGILWLGIYELGGVGDHVLLAIG